MILGFVLSIFGMVGEFISPLYIGWVIDAITSSDMAEVKHLILWWMIFNTSGAIFAGLQSFTFQLTTQKIGKNLIQDVFEQIINKDIAFFDTKKTGELISRLQADTAKIENALST